MSKTNNIERNKLDYLLTDTMPVEVSELFSFGAFYDYLFSRRKELDRLIHDMKKKKAKSNQIPFSGSWGRWVSTPLKYRIMKGTDSIRELSLVQPLAALNMFFFVECYQKEILDRIRENSCFSVRYHRKNRELYYRRQKGRGAGYFLKEAGDVDKAVLQQTGAYFSIHRFDSLTNFTNSRVWRSSNFRCRSYAKVDYKSCFNSIYSHAYKWCITKDTVDSKAAQNSNLHIVIDRVLQNINGHSSNGLVIGPEFSRMMAEILLGQIDMEVRQELAEKGLHQWKDYRVFRYVDDIFIFSGSREDTDRIIATIENVARRYMLRLNDLKYVKSDTPVVPSAWIGRTRELTDRIAALFHTTNEARENKKPLLKNEKINRERMKEDFLCLIHDYPGDQRHIVSYMLSTLMNKVSQKKDLGGGEAALTLFDPKKTEKAFVLLDLAFYYYSFCPCFDHGQKIMSMIVYMDDELHFRTDEQNFRKLQNLIRRYAFIFEKGNLNDLCNWFLFFREFGIILKSGTEESIEARMEEEDNPLLWANYLIYSRYDTCYNDAVKDRLDRLLADRMIQLGNDDIMLKREFWYILVFINCPDVTAQRKEEMRQKLRSLKKANPSSYSEKMIAWIVDFLLEDEPNRFFCWADGGFSVSRQLTFRTYQRTLFKQYKKRGVRESYGSLDT